MACGWRGTSSAFFRLVSRKVKVSSSDYLQLFEEMGIGNRARHAWRCTKSKRCTVQCKVLIRTGDWKIPFFLLVDAQQMGGGPSKPSIGYLPNLTGHGPQYCVQFWAPKYEMDLKLLLESFQRRTLMMVKSLEGET